MQAQTADQPNFHTNSIRALFQFDFPNFPSPLWGVSADGQRFAVLTADHTKSASITLLTNWPAELGKISLFTSQAWAVQNLAPLRPPN